MNRITKIYTTIISHRLIEWSENSNTLPERQAGFRKERGTTDNILTLRVIIDTIMNQPHKKLFAIFVDFKTAFELFPHNLLWEKLKEIGISNNMIRSLTGLNQSANITLEEYDMEPIRVIK